MIYWIYALLCGLSSTLTRQFGNRIFAGAYLGAAGLSLFFISSIWLQAPDTLVSPVKQTSPTQASFKADKPGSLLTVTGDLAEIKKRGRLRVLLSKQNTSSGLTNGTAKNLISQYAHEQNLEIDWIDLNKSKLISNLQRGKGDIVLSALVSQDQSAQIQLTLPWGVSQQRVISRTDTGQIRTIGDLKTRQIAIKRSSPVWQELQVLLQNNPSMDLTIIPESADTESILQKIASAQYDVTVMDNLTVEPFLPRFLNLEVAFNISEAKTISWAVRSDANELHTSLNGFLNKHYLQASIARTYQEDLPALQRKKLLRVITLQNPVNYYLHRGKLKGFEHDLMKRFSEMHQMRLDLVIADSHEEMRELLLQGKGDVVAASLPRRSFQDNTLLAFSQAYSHAAPVIIGRTKDTPVLDVKGLNGRRVVLPAASPYEELLRSLKNQGIEMDIIMAAAGESTENILHRVAEGVYDLSIVGGLELKAQLARQINLRAHFALTEPLPHVWAVRKADTQLLSALNEFVGKEFRKGFYNVLYSKYIDKPVSLLGDTQLLAGNNEKLSPYDDIVHKYAEHYDFDWRLIVAQMYQESQFDPDAISYAGAEGLMQLIPATAELLGISDVNDPDTSIGAGIRYLDYLRGKFEDDLLLEDRLWFSLAAYNAGYGRVHRARLLAEKMNLDKNKWFDNVEKAMLVLARPYWKDGETTRNCRCGQTVVYVRDINTLYKNYVRLTRGLKTVSNISEISTDI
jgi:membrane-bound lytic murein transglycosylase F